MWKKSSRRCRFPETRRSDSEALIFMAESALSLSNGDDDDDVDDVDDEVEDDGVIVF